MVIYSLMAPIEVTVMGWSEKRRLIGLSVDDWIGDVACDGPGGFYFPVLIRGLWFDVHSKTKPQMERL